MPRAAVRYAAIPAVARGFPSPLNDLYHQCRALPTLSKCWNPRGRMLNAYHVETHHPSMWASCSFVTPIYAARFGIQRLSVLSGRLQRTKMSAIARGRVCLASQMRSFGHCSIWRRYEPLSPSAESCILETLWARLYKRVLL